MTSKKLQPGFTYRLNKDGVLIRGAKIKVGYSQYEGVSAATLARATGNDPRGDYSYEQLGEMYDQYLKSGGKSEKAEVPQGWISVNGGRYHAVSEVRKTLPAGTYSVDVEEGKEIFSKVNYMADEAIDLPGLPTKYIVDQIGKFWTKEDEYKKYGFLHKRGILLYGEPGCGKSSIISLLTKQLIENDGVIILVDDFTTASRCIRRLRAVEPTRPIMTLMEDIEGLFQGDQGNRQVKAALSFLDGQDQVNNIVHIATTNEPSQLADRFIKRPGRFDLIIGIHPPTKETREAYLRYITKDKLEDKTLNNLVEKTDGLTLAYLREIVSTHLCLGIDLEETVSRLRKNVKRRSLTLKKGSLGFSIGYEQDKVENKMESD